MSYENENLANKLEKVWKSLFSKKYISQYE